VANSLSRIAGVAGGLAEHFGTDPTLLRAILRALASCGGAGLVLYIVLWIAIPRQPDAEPDEHARSTERAGVSAA
jgi:phage shock protein C